jgi:hypothetical protein
MGVSQPRLRGYCLAEGVARPPTNSDVRPTPINRFFSALALWELMDESQRPREVWFLLTPEADSVAWAAVQAEAEQIGVRVHSLRIPAAAGSDDFLHQVAEQIPTGSSLTIDITQGLRHHAFLFFALSMYLSMFRDIALDGVWYAQKLSDSSDAPRAFVDLEPVQRLVRWFVALTVFNDTGSTKELARLVGHRKLRDLLEEFSEEFMTGLPMEAGITASKASKLLQQLGPSVLGVPLSDELHTQIGDSLAPYCLEIDPKKARELDEQELQRQKVFIEQYLRSGQSNLAYGFMREWVVSSVMHHHNVRRGWLKGGHRENFENKLGALITLIRTEDDPNRGRLDAEQRAYAQRLQKLINIRNALQHHGMQETEFPKKAMRKLVNAWHQANWGVYPPLGGDSGRLLICPVNKSVGVLYSALCHTRPQRCFIICTEAGAAEVARAFAAADWDGEHDLVIIEDPKGGYAQRKPLIQHVSRWLYDAKDVAVSLTGGTTLMSILAGQVAQHAGRAYHRPTWEFVLIDRREREEQRQNPWVVSELQTISEKSNNFEETAGV